jgi:hypothetical protein
VGGKGGGGGRGEKFPKPCMHIRIKKKRNKLGMVVDTYNSIYSGSRNRKVKANPEQKCETISEN